MAKIIQMRSHGGPEVLEIVHFEVGAPGPGQVRLVQEAIGINAVDGLVRKGLYPMALPAVPGFEAAGVVDAVGPGVTAFAPGDRAAYFFVQGAYATVALVPASALVPLPDDVDLTTATTLLAKGLTAWMGLRALYGLSAGDTALVLGASGSVGSLLSRWAKALGGTVIGVAGSLDKLDKVQAGVAHALLASDPHAAARIREIAPGGVDVVYDLVGQATFDLAAQAVRDGGVIATIGAASGQSPSSTEALSRRGIQIRGGGTPQHVRGPTVSVATGELWAAHRAGLFDDLETARYPFDAIARAHADMDARRMIGLPVLIP
jgi:NADPH2:quinone reductase